jgi:DNA-binding CsgD family transcriptional regulator/tetratricopeptide (TPR) repeat protein
VHDALVPTVSQTELLAAGRAAIARADWAEASRIFSELLAAGESAEAEWRLAQALWFLNDVERSLAHHRRAYALFRAEGDDRAVRIACWIAIEHALIYGDVSVARGWFARAAELAGPERPTSGTGWLLLMRAAFEENVAALEASARASLDLGRMVGDLDLEVCSLVMLGQAVVLQGQVHEGLELVEQAMGSVVAGELDDPTVVADCFCVMLATCECAGDYDLAEQWVRTAASYAQQRSCPFVAAQCRTTYAGLLIAAGRWKDAEEELLGALRIYATGHRGLGPQVAAKLADLRIRQGALEEAEDLLAGLEHLPAAKLPLARMALVRGDPRAALALIGPAVPEGELRLGDMPAGLLAVEAEVAAGELAAGAELVDRLSHLARQAGSPMYQAEASLWRSRVAAAAGDTVLAAALADAAAQCPYPDAPLAGRIHLEQARQRAGTDAALALLRSLGSPTRLPPRSGDEPAGALSRREQEVLALVGAGLSNPQIASRLYLSPRTVEHHVGHIFAKLGLSSRAALAAYAARQEPERGHQ